MRRDIEHNPLNVYTILVVYRPLPPNHLISLKSSSSLYSPGRMLCVSASVGATTSGAEYKGAFFPNYADCVNTICILFLSILPFYGV